MALIALSGVIALISNLGSSQAALQLLYIANPQHAGLQDIVSGQVWRLVTPIFIHFGIMHFVFNMMWVWDLGKLIESKKGPGFYIGFILLVGALSNLAQYLLTRSPFFGGMSGVVYGLFGYVWIRGRFDPTFSDGLHKTTVNMMLAWFVLCWTGLLGPIANWAHTLGLLAGVVWAYFENKSLDPLKMIAVESLPKKQKLEYLSTSDMLQIEQQRQWVREHYLPEARGKYASVEGKLNIISAILSQGPTTGQGKKQEQEQRALEIVFGDALVQETGLQWAIWNDDTDRTPVLITPGSPTIIFPLVTVPRLAAHNKALDVQHLFTASVASIRQQMQGRS